MLFNRSVYDVAIAAIDEGAQTGPLTDPMARAWAELGRGSMSDALAAFDVVIAEREELAPFALYFKALALAFVGDLERAETLLTGEAEGPIGLSRRGVVAHISILSQLGRMDDALQLTDAMFGAAPDQDVADLRRRAAGGTCDPVRDDYSARDGMAETYFTLAAALPVERGRLGLPLIYARLALALRPDPRQRQSCSPGSFLERAEQYSLAKRKSYDRMPADDPQILGRAAWQGQCACPQRRCRTGY